MLGVAANRPARILLVAGCLGAVALHVGLLAGAVRDEVPIVFAVFGLFVLVFVGVTRASVAVAPGALAIGGIVGVAAALIPAAVLALRPPVPQSSAWAVAVVAVAVAAAVALTPPRGGPLSGNAVVSGLLAGMISAIVIGPVVAGMAQFGPESWVPRTTSHALTPAARLAERRNLAGEPYLVLLLLGVALALILGALVLWMRQRARTPPPLPPVGERQLIDLGER